MERTAHRAIAIVGVSAILPDAPSAAAFWQNVKSGHYSITDVTPDRWDPALYYDPDPKAPDKTYSQIGGWVRQWEWNPLQWGLPIPPRVSDAMDDGQKWAVACSRAALLDYGHPQRPLDLERTAVIVGNAMAGEKHYLTALRIYFPEYAHELAAAPSFAALPPAVQTAITTEMHAGVGRRFPEISEDTMPGELSNCIAGRIANLFNLRGPNYVVDAACASAIAAISAATEGLAQGDYDAVLAGGIDRNMGASSYVKFCKIGALSATGTRPYADGADGFVMGEGAVMFLLKRLVDAERAGDTIYAVLRGIGGASDGKGKGITAPNPVGQRLAVQRAWQNSALSPATATLIEGHGTSTRVGDVVEVEGLADVFGEAGAAPGAIALGSVKSNIGHLKAAAGGAGLLKAVMALHEKVLPPSLHFDRPNPNIDFAHCPFFVNTELKPWEVPAAGVRRAGVSAFGFGGTNFHVVLEEYIPGRLANAAKSSVRVAAAVDAASIAAAVSPKAPLRGALVVGAESERALIERLRSIQQEASQGRAPTLAAPAESDLRAVERIAIDYGDAADLADKAAKALKAMAANNAGMWKALRAQGVFRGHGPAPKVAFLYTGQGSQYANMLQQLRAIEPIIADTFATADCVMIPLLGKPLTDYIFVDSNDPAVFAKAEDNLRQTAITQPAVLATDAALTGLLAAYGITPDLVMGHSLGEYGALIAADALPFADALEAVSARGREMTNLAVEDNGLMAAVFAPLPEVQRILKTIDGYVVIANVNSNSQSVIGGATAAVQRAMEAFVAAGYNAVQLPVSHAFHTKIVAPASEPLRRTLQRLRLQPPSLPIVANVTGELYPMGPGVVPQMLDILAQQVAAPVQFVKGLQTLYAAGVRLFVEVGPKKALQGFVDDVFGDRSDVASLFTNHPKLGDLVSFNQALCGLYAAGLGVGRAAVETRDRTAHLPAGAPRSSVNSAVSTPVAAPSTDTYLQLGRLVTDFLDKAGQIYRGQAPAVPSEPVVISGAALGLPGTDRIFDDANVGRILNGEQCIDVIPTRFRRAMLDKHITRLVKSDQGGPTFEVIDNAAEVIKLAGRGGAFDLGSEFGVSAERLPAFDITTRLAIGAGLDALRDAGIPLVLRYRTTSKGTHLPERWVLPDALRDDTGVIFASAFPGYDELVADLTHYYTDHAHREQLATLESLRTRLEQSSNGHGAVVTEIDHRAHDLRAAIEQNPYAFDRRFLFRILSMGHSQFAELIGARGPNTQINSACASSTQAVALAEDWIRAGRCRRVIIIAGDDVTSDRMLEWIGAGFLASGAAATDDVVEEAAIPFDRRRHGMLLGMGAAAMIVESAEAVRERGIRPICEVLSTVTANSAFHGTRLDVDHICQMMESVITQAERRWGIQRQQIAPQTVFVSHETYTPARGGSAAAEVHALRAVFGAAADQIVVANTKGFTGHAMGVGIEDVVAIKSLETGLVPPVANFKEIDPDLGPLNLSKGGAYPVEYALRLAAGFGSQISLTLMRWVPTPDGMRPDPDRLGFSYRVADANVWKACLNRISGNTSAELEVVSRTLRVKDQGPAERAAQPVALPPTEVRQPGSVQIPAPPPAVAAEGAPPDRVDGTTDGVKERVLTVVAEKTGYPADMLDLDLDLEADLGIDTVKQAEVFAAIRETYNIPRDEKLKLRDFPTLAHVIQFVRERRPDLAALVVAETAQAAARPASSPLQRDTGDAVKERVLALFAEKTGYPPDMLDPDLDLESDLGIDTVKQAEMFAAIREAYDIPRDEKLKLRDFPTLAHVIQFVRDRRPDRDAAVPTPHPEAQHAVPLAGRGGSLDAANRIPRRVPIPTLRPPLHFCKSTGVTLDGGSRVLVMPDQGGVAKALLKQLKRLGVHTQVLDPAADAGALTEGIISWLTQGPLHGVYWLPALDPEPDISEMDLAAWRAALHVRVKLLYATMRAVHEHVAQAGTFLISATRLGGQHGYDEAGAYAPLGGPVVGFTKAYKRERDKALVKAVDFGPQHQAAEVADALVEETLRDPGVVEIGHKSGKRWSVGMLEQPAVDGEGGLALSRDSVFVVTGAAGSIVSAIIADLAAASGGTFYLLDKVPQPDPESLDIQRFVTDRDNLKRELFERIRARGERATPALVERELAALERAHAALGALQAVRAAGGVARYYSVDLTDADAVARVIEDVRQHSGHIDALIHAAGLEISRFLPDKEPREFDLVFDVKSDGWFNLLHAIGSMPLRATVAFSSIAGRFGNGGQTDYSAANDLLCKCSTSFRTTRPGTRGIAIDWTAWGGIGMATRGSIPKMMEVAGIDMLPADAGIPIVRRELIAGTRGEVVIAERLGILLNEWDDTGGVDAGALLNGKSAQRGPMLGKVVGMPLHGGLTVETILDPTAQPFLHDHQIDGTPVLPGVMGVEAFAELATLLLPDWHVAAIEDVEFLAPFKFYRNEPRVVTLSAVWRPDGDTIVADCRLTGSRNLPNQPEPQVTTHFTGRVRLVNCSPEGIHASVPHPANGGGVTAPDIYRIYFHGPAYQVLQHVWRDGATTVGLMAEALPDDHTPRQLAMLMTPRLIELCFQTAGIWEIGTTGHMGLPQHIDRVSTLRVPDASSGRLHAVVNTNIEAGSFDARVLDGNGDVCVDLHGYRTVELPTDIDAGDRKALEAAMG